MPRALVMGGAGFLGSHLCERLLGDGWDVDVVDSFLTGSATNVEHLRADERLSVRHGDVSVGLESGGPVDLVVHLASPASPPDYLRYPLETLAAGAAGTRNALRLATERKAVFLLASTSEVYGDPLVTPQPETYWGNVNPIGPRSVYDEAKRYAEALTMAHARSLGTRVRIARIFNTYGPRMRRDDGRALPTFVDQALGGRELTLHGDGSQTRSFCFVTDLIEGLVRLAASDVAKPVNLGNPHEITVRQLAERVSAIARVPLRLVTVERPEDDPQRRCPDITKARTELDWNPSVDIDTGLRMTIAWARDSWPPA